MRLALARPLAFFTFLALVALAAALGAMVAGPRAAFAGDPPSEEAVANDLAARSLSDDPAVRAAAEAEYGRAPADVKLRVLVAIAKRLREASVRRLDGLIDLALASEGEKRVEALRALAESGAAAVERLVERLAAVGKASGASPAAAIAVANLEVRVYEVPAAFADELRKEGEAVAYPLDPVQLETFLRAVAKTPGAKVVSQPRITTYDGQRASVEVLEAVSYIQDYDVETAGGAVVVDPIVGTVHEGLVLQTTPRMSADRRYVTLDLEMTFAVVKRPIPEHETTIGNRKVRIQLPEVRKQTRRVSVTLPSGGTVLIAGPESPEGKGAPRTIVLVRAEAGVVVPETPVVPSVK